jgi:hypothetical protein
MNVPVPRAGIRRLVPAGATLLLALAIGACSAGPARSGVVSLQDPSTSPARSAAPTASIDPEEAMQAFAACMREHGVDIQVATAGEGTEVGGGPQVIGNTRPGGAAQPGTGPGNQEDFQAAEEACRDLLPAGGMGDPNATMDPELADQLLEFAQCMRDHGIDMPDPQFNGGGMTVEIGGPEGEGIDPQSEAFQEAQEACGDALPGGGPGEFRSGVGTAP